jgi:hypothetical protein
MKHLVAAPRKAGASQRNSTDVVATCFHGTVMKAQAATVRHAYWPGHTSQRHLAPSSHWLESLG